MNLPALMPNQTELSTMKELCSTLVQSGFLPSSIKSPHQALAIMLKGRELNLPPMQSFSSIAIISGKPTMSSELMLSMIYRNCPGAIVNFEVTDATVCKISAKRPNGKATDFSFSMEDAKRAGLAGKGPWATYPAAMLRARCVSAMARAIFPDALSGVVYTPEEMGAEVDEEGQVKDVTPPEPPPAPKAEAPKQVPPPAKPPIYPQAAATAKAERKVTDPQLKRLFAIQSAHGWTEEDVKKELLETYGLDSRKDLNMADYELLCAHIQENDQSAAPEMPFPEETP